MIYLILTASILYLILSAAALVLIAEKDRDAYFDVRNIITSLFWWVVLCWLGIVWLAGRITYKKLTKNEDNGTINQSRTH